MHRRPGLPSRGRRLAGAAIPPVLCGERVTSDLSVEVGGLELRGPVLAASGTFGYGTEVPLLERRALGAMVSKGIFLKPRAGTAPPRIAETPSGMLNAIGLQGPGVDGLIRDYAPKWAAWDFPVLVNINGESAAEYGELSARLDGVPGVAGFEINISCPNVEQGGMYFGNDPRAAASVTEAVRRRTKLPVWVKLTPMVSDIGIIARAVEAAGADALSAVNTFVGMSMDLNAYQPRLSFRTGGLSGPAIRPLAVHLAHQAARAVDIPVIGVGGIMRAEDALEFLVAGCRAVQVGTATFVNPNAIAEVHDGIAAFMAAKGFASLSELPRYLPRD
ncbi:MAG: dihydroorotate dehydrogenase [Chloroflexi bacterium]|nr:MAG: dihydroorotate dehydrogenase [Chloroflexota bacterium]